MVNMAILMLVIIPPAILCFLAWFTFWKFGEPKRGEAQMGAWMALTIPFDTYIMFYRDGLERERLEPLRRELVQVGN